MSRATPTTPRNKTTDDNKPRVSLRPRRVLISVGLLMLVLATIYVWKTELGTSEVRGSGFNVLLVTLDTTRADYLGCYGHPGGHTPNLDALALSGARFSQCISASPSTLPSHASIMTGLYPFVHGARDNVGYRLSRANSTLAETLQSAGYRTAAFVSAFVVKDGVGLEQGFDHYGDAGTRRERPANEVADEAVDWLKNNGNSKFFLWTHFFDPHYPYSPPTTYQRRYKDAYQGEIAFVDSQVGRLIDTLRNLEIDDRTLIVITADHGEGLNQHDEETHTYFLYDTTIHVPLILNCPDRIPANETIDEQVRTVDIEPTILSFLGISSPTTTTTREGRDLTQWLQGSEHPSDLPAYAESLAGSAVFGLATLRCLRTGDWKYIHTPQTELYNVASDPRELSNLAAENDDLVQQLREDLRALIALAPEPLAREDARVDTDQQTLDMLSSLGYLGGGKPPVQDSISELDQFDVGSEDLKAYRDVIKSLGRATAYENRRQFDEAEKVHRQVIQRFPHSLDLRKRLVRAIFMQGRLQEALEIYEQLSLEFPDDYEVHYGAGKLLGRLGRGRQAIESYAEAIRCNPDYPEAHYDLGVVLLQEGHAIEAEQSFQKALQLNPRYVNAMANLAVCLSRREEYKQAIELYRRALSIAPNDAGLHFNLGNTLLRVSDYSGAMAAYQETLRIDPQMTVAQEAIDHLMSSQ